MEERTQAAGGKLDPEQVRVFEDMISQKIARLVIENHGPNFMTPMDLKDPLSLQKKIYDLMKLF